MSKIIATAAIRGAHQIFKQAEEALRAEGRAASLRFKVETRRVDFEDLIKGRMSFEGQTMGDFIILRSAPSSIEPNSPVPVPARMAAPRAPASLTRGRTKGAPRISAQIRSQASDLLPPPAAR